MKFTRITVDPDKMGGVPCVRGLRIPVATVVGMVANGMTEKDILKAYPDLEPVGPRLQGVELDAGDSRRRARCSDQPQKCHIASNHPHQILSGELAGRRLPESPRLHERVERHLEAGDKVATTEEGAHTLADLTRVERPVAASVVDDLDGRFVHFRVTNPRVPHRLRFLGVDFNASLVQVHGEGTLRALNAWNAVCGAVDEGLVHPLEAFNPFRAGGETFPVVSVTAEVVKAKADPLAALVMVPIISKEGIDALRGEVCCD